MSPKIHPTAIVDSKSELGENVSIAPYAVIEGNVVIGDGTSIGSHAVVGWGSRLGRNCRVFNGASVGTIPQDLKFAGEKTVLEIGDNTIIREFCTLNRGTSAAGRTLVGSNCALLAYCHVAHDCVVGNNVVASNGLALAGHVEVGSHVTFGGYVTFHQFCRLGSYVMVGGFTGVNKDVPPFMLVRGPSTVRGVNLVGLRRGGFSREIIKEINEAYSIFFKSELTTGEALKRIRQTLHSPETEEFASFIESSKRGICKYRYTREEYFE